MTNHSEAGFTLTELVVVSALIAIVSAIAVVEGRAKLSVAASCGVIQNVIGDAANLAVTRGPIAPELVLDEDGALPLEQRGARTRVEFTPGDPVWVTMDLRQESADGSETTWERVISRSMDKRFLIDSTAPLAAAAALSPGEVSPAPGDAFSAKVTIFCYPDGRCDQLTVYARRSETPPAPHRIVVTAAGDSSTSANW